LKTGVIWSIVVICVVLAFSSPTFLKPDNLVNIIKQVSITAIMAMGMTFVLIGGGIDLSVGSMLALTSVLGASVMVTTNNLMLALITALGSGCLLGFAQGLLITKFKIAPFAITLGGMSIFRGATLLFTNGVPINKLPDSFRWFGAGEAGILPGAVICLIIMLAVMTFLLMKTKFGRYVYAIGSNENTSRLSGINVNFIRTLTYVMSALCAAVAGLVLAGRLNAAHPYSGEGYEMTAIAAAVIGGTSVSGGEGTMYGTIIGALIIGIIQNGLNLLQINAFWQEIVIGSVIIVAVLIDSFRINMSEKMAVLDKDM
jgi:ribose transport system permease protein